MRLLATTILALSAAAFADPQWQPAPRADDFVESIGVCTHWTYRNTPYGTGFDKVKDMLAASGIRNVRDSADPKALSLWPQYGIRLTPLAEPREKNLEQNIALFKDNAPGIAMIEGPNEPNLFWIRFNVKYKDEGYPKGLKLWQDDLYKAVRAEPLLANIPVCAPSPIFDGAFDLAPLNSFDLVATHPYAGGQMPSVAVEWNNRTMRTTHALVGVGHDLKRPVATESGYHTALGGTKVLAGSQPGISETASGKYFPRHFAEFWRAGFARTYVYELVDEHPKADDAESNFGLIRNDLTPKPSYTALSNMIAILSESTWDKSATRWIKSDAPARAAQIDIAGPASVHHIALSRADGAIDLLVWNEVSSFDTQKGKDLTNAPVAATIKLPTPLAATVYQPLKGTEPQQRMAASTAISLQVPDEIIIVRLAAATPTGSTPQVPADLTVSTTPTSATLKWKAAGIKPAAYIVSRLGAYLATVEPAADGSASYTDSALTPGYGFAYEVVAVSSTGLISAPSSIVAKTPNQRPDLVIQDVRWSPENPKPGDEVKFTITIANIGSAPTPAVVHGAAIKIDGKTVCWSDTHKSPIEPKGSVTVTTNNGASGKGFWVCTPGTFKIEAVVDDVNRIDESNEKNNVKKAVLSTGVGADLIVAEVKTKGPAQAGKPVTLIGVVKNIGSAPSPDGVTLSCTFITESADGKWQALGYGTIRKSIEPGQSAELVIQKPWTPTTAGTYKIIGVADDVDRIAELREDNNRSEPATIEVK